MSGIQMIFGAVDNRGLSKRGLDAKLAHECKRATKTLQYHVRFTSKGVLTLRVVAVMTKTAITAQTTKIVLVVSSSYSSAKEGKSLLLSRTAKTTETAMKALLTLKLNALFRRSVNGTNQKLRRTGLPLLILADFIHGLNAPAPLVARRHFGGGGGAPPRGIFNRPHSFTHPTPRSVCTEWCGGWGCIKFDPPF